ncbi:MAG: winged helix-turn-helix domain-containing protein [Candidatus Gastranaerophilaceae bacterium]
MQESLEQSIGFSAGQIYNYLAENEGQSTFTKLKKELDLKGNFAELGLGWLAREDKIEMAKSGNTFKIKLR